MMASDKLKSWLGSSKVVLEDGSPRVVYHGTASDFAIFQRSRGGEFGPAIYTTDSPREASEYGVGQQRPGVNVMPVYVRIENPYIDGVDSFWARFNGDDGDAAAISRAKAAGYDGVIAKRPDIYFDNATHTYIDRGDTLTHFVAFDPDQVKSAIGNQGFFSRHSEDIRFSLPPRPAPTAGQTTVSTEALRSWHAGSCVALADGSPRVVFHGTGADTGNVMRPGSFFTTMPEIADIYASAKSRQTDAAGPNVIPVYLSIKRPYLFDAGAIRDNLSHHVLGKRGPIEKVIEKLKAEGYDGIHLLNYPDLGGIQDQFCVFHSNQVKSVFNDGSFSATDDLRYSLRAREHSGLLRDSYGEPLWLFHGTSFDFEAFEVGGSAFFGAGLYFTENAQAAGSFAEESGGGDGERLIPVFLRMQNPFIFDAPFAWEEPTNFSLIDHLFTGRENSRVKRSADQFGNFNTEFQHRLEAMGHDGLIVRMPDGEAEYVVWHPEQVISAISGDVMAAKDQLQRHSFAGKRAVRADIEQMHLAQAAVSAGDDPDIVRRVTGWHQGVDGRWRFEISDHEAHLLPAIATLRGGGFKGTTITSVTYKANGDGTFDLTLNPPHPERVGDFVSIYSATAGVLDAVLPAGVVDEIRSDAGEEDLIGDFQPAKRLRWEFDFGGLNALPLDHVLYHPSLFESYPSLAYMMVKVDPKLGIGASLGTIQDGTKVITIGTGQQLKSLLHEVQHQLQEIETFAQGTTAADAFEEINNRLAGLAVEIFDPSIVACGHDPAVSARVAMARRLIGADHYRRTAGEIEARNAESRMGLTSEQRVTSSPVDTADVPLRATVRPSRSEHVERVLTAIGKLLGLDANAVPTGVGNYVVIDSADVPRDWVPLGPTAAHVAKHAPSPSKYEVPARS